MSRSRSLKLARDGFADPNLTIHMVEVGGRGGVFQHSAALAGALADAGCSVTLHTATDAESTVPGVRFCGCLSWYRTLPRWLRRVAVLGHFIARTLPHLLRQKGDVTHIQGTFALPLTAITIALCKQRSSLVAFSPHNTFRRSRLPFGMAVLRRACRSADVVFAFSKSDLERLYQWRARALFTEMVFLVPKSSTEAVLAWRERLGSPLVLMPGFVRPDKRPDLFVGAMALLPELQGAIVGEDHGGIDSVRESAAVARVKIVEEYLSLEEFTAVVAAAEVVVCPYDRASQSGVLTVASELGVPTVATAVGGLEELATISVPKGDVGALAQGIRKAIALGRQAPRSWGVAAARETLRGYGVTAKEPE